MADVFISYSTKDQNFANFLYNHLTKEGLKIFLAPITLDAGNRWSEKILNELKVSEWVLFLASKAACQSPAVQQEMGASIAWNKNIIPVVWEIRPENLPGWTKEFQAMSLASATIETIQEEFTKLAKRIKSEQWKGLLIAGILIGALVYLSKS